MELTFNFTRISSMAHMLRGTLARAVGGQKMWAKNGLGDGTPYRIEFLDGSQNICATVDLPCAHDQDAIGEAYKADIFANNGFIVRQGQRVVHRRRGL